MIKLILIIGAIIVAGWLFKKFVSPILSILGGLLVTGFLVIIVVVGLTVLAGIGSGFVESVDEEGAAPLVEQYDGINKANEATISFMDKTDSRMECPEDAGFGVKVFRGVDKVIRKGQNKLNSK